MGCQASVAVGNTTEYAWKGVRSGFHEDYSLDMSRKLGEGSFGQVRVTFRKGSGTQCAVKVVDMREGPGQSGDLNICSGQVDKKAASYVKAEVQVWERLGKHKHCISLLDTYVDNGFCFMVMERCVASLPEWLQDGRTNRGYLSMTEILRQMLLGIQHVHKQGIVHRDVKPENFLMATDGVKLCDFGLAAILPINGKVKGVVGTPSFMSPEMLTLSTYDSRTDLWSYGVSMYMLLFGQLPFVAKERSSTAIKATIREGLSEPSYIPEARLPVPPPSATSLIKRLLVRSPGNRASAAHILGTAFFTDQGEEISAVPFAIRKSSRRSFGDLQQSSLESLQKASSDHSRLRRANSDVSSSCDQVEGTNSYSTVSLQDSTSLEDVQDMTARRISRQSTSSITFSQSTASMSHSMTLTPKAGARTGKRVSTITTDTCSTATGTSIAEGAILDLDAASTTPCSMSRSGGAPLTEAVLHRSGTESLSNDPNVTFFTSL
mmetsp:Transcript_60363/g.112005  ORF Transcript_60363/g.112005 Transcript_60363/m.112005 type:complete len:491 (+) Transcript_60363:195-1667(+)